MDLSSVLATEPDFRDFCDGVLLLEVGALVQLFRGDGRDGGIDAEYEGTFAGVDGRWVFQYKFAASRRDATQVRAELLKKLKARDFRSSRIKGCDVYVLMTMIPATVAWREKLRKAWEDAGHPGRLQIWDVGHLAQLATRHGFPGVSVSARARQVALAEIVRPLHDYVAVEHLSAIQEPCWPVLLAQAQVPATEAVSFTGQGAQAAEWAFRYDVCALPERPADRPLMTACWTVFFPTAGRAVENLVESRHRLADAILAELGVIENQITTLLARHAPDLSPTDQQRAAMGLAHGVACTAWSIQQRIRLLGERLELLSVHTQWGPNACPIATEPWVPGFAQELLALANDLRRDGVPQVIHEARSDYFATRDDFISEAWYPLNLGVDRPRFVGRSAWSAARRRTKRPR